MWYELIRHALRAPVIITALHAFLLIETISRIAVIEENDTPLSLFHVYQIASASLTVMMIMRDTQQNARCL